MRNPFKRKTSVQPVRVPDEARKEFASHSEAAIAQLHHSLANLSRELGARSTAIAQLQHEAEDLGRVHMAMSAAMDILDPKQRDEVQDDTTVDEDNATLKGRRN